MKDLREGYTPIKSQQHTLKAEFHVHKAAARKDQHTTEYTENGDMENGLVGQGVQKMDSFRASEGSFGNKISGELRKGPKKRSVKDNLHYEQLAA